MKRSWILLGLAFGLVFFSCETGGDNLPSEEDIKTAIEEWILSDVLSSSEGLDDSNATDGDNMTYDKSTAEIEPPIRWRRFIENVDRLITVEVSGDTVATVTIEKDVTGTLRIFDLNFDSLDTFGLPVFSIEDTIEKAISAHGIRTVNLVRENSANVVDISKNWKRTSVSPAEIQSDSTTISFLQLVATNLTTGEEVINVEDPSVALTREQIPKFHPGDEVRVDIYLRNTSNFTPSFIEDSLSALANEGVVLHYGIRKHAGNIHKARKRFELLEVDSTGLKHFQQTYEIGKVDQKTVYHAFFDVINFGMLFDDEMPHNAVIWGLPYVVFPNDATLDTEF